MAADFSARVLLRDVAIVGGGCYGTFYARQLIQARERGKADFRRLLVIDRDPECRFAREVGPADGAELAVDEWDRFFDRWLDRNDDGAGDAIVPSPLMPHLMFGWLSRRASARWPGRLVEHRPLEPDAETPYDMLAPDGTRYVSFADWLCPVHCIEPAVCPVIRGPRSWEISEAAERLVERRSGRAPSAGPVLFVCRHRVHGVGMFDVSSVLAGDAAVARAGAGGEVGVVVGTVSACHGALSLLHLGGGPAW
ncbi:MAG TPA: hypothetical protein VJQ44_17220 [Gemmatimonadales bacterium]|nr:hypothetical protein [Gemmatimonadales bacterium]